MEVRHIQKVERKLGVASTVKFDDFLPQYTEGVERFLRDNSSLGEDWVRQAGEKLYSLQGKNKEGDLLGSSTDVGVAIATFTDIPLIRGSQSLELYKQAGDKNPFGSVYIDFGANINGNPNTNPFQAELLLKDFKKRGIKIGDGRVPDLVQLRLIASPEAGLAYKLADGVTADNIALVSAYPFRKEWIGKNGLFRAYLNWFGYWDAGVGSLADSNDCGRVVRYDAEGVVPKKLEKDLAGTLTEEFSKRF